MVTSISDIRVAPVGEDLTKEDLALSVLRGLEKMFRVDKKVAVGETFTKGEWAVLDTDGLAARPGAVPAAGSYLVFSGTDRFDSKATGMVTLIMSWPVIVKTDKYDTTVPSYAVGDYLTVKDLGGGEAYVTKQSSSEAKLARVLEVGTGYLVFETLSV